MRRDSHSYYVRCLSLSESKFGTTLTAVFTVVIWERFIMSQARPEGQHRETEVPRYRGRLTDNNVVGIDRRDEFDNSGIMDTALGSS